MKFGSRGVSDYDCKPQTGKIPGILIYEIALFAF